MDNDRELYERLGLTEGQWYRLSPVTRMEIRRVVGDCPRPGSLAGLAKYVLIGLLAPVVLFVVMVIYFVVKGI